MTDAELAARIVLSMAELDPSQAGDVQRIVEALGVTDAAQTKAVAQRLYELGWLSTLVAQEGSLLATLGKRGREIVRETGPLEALTRHFERGGSLVVDARSV